MNAEIISGVFLIEFTDFTIINFITLMIMNDLWFFYNLSALKLPYIGSRKSPSEVGVWRGSNINRQRENCRHLTYLKATLNPSLQTNAVSIQFSTLSSKRWCLLKLLILSYLFVINRWLWGRVTWTVTLHGGKHTVVVHPLPWQPLVSKKNHYLSISIYPLALFLMIE